MRFTQTFRLAIIVGIIYATPAFPCSVVELDEERKKELLRHRKLALVRAAATHLNVKSPLVQKSEVQDFRQNEGGSESTIDCYRPTVTEGTVKLTYEPRPGSVAVCHATVKVEKIVRVKKDDTVEIEVVSGPHCR